MTYCNKCDKEVPEGAKFCRFCGHKLKQVSEDAPYCHECGKEVDPYAVFCRNCGHKLKVEEDVEEEKPDEQDEEKWWYCEYCEKEFATEVEALRHERECPEKKAKDTVREVHVHQDSGPIQNNHQSGSKAWIIIVVIIIIIGAMLLMNMYNEAAYQRTASGQVESAISKIFG